LSESNHRDGKCRSDGDWHNKGASWRSMRSHAWLLLSQSLGKCRALGAARASGASRWIRLLQSL
jgi:hypothetical protein